MDQQDLIYVIEEAKKARNNALLINAQVAVGACVVTEDKLLYPGCNINSVITGLGLCAERCAIDHAVVHGKYKYATIVTFGDNYIYPCGACLQYMAFFSQISGKDIEIICAKPDLSYMRTSLSELLPFAYKPSHYNAVLEKYRIK